MADVDEDGDAIGLDAEMEPESPTGEAPESDEPDDGDDEVAAGGPISARVNAPRGTRPVSDKVRELAKQIAAANKDKIAKGEHDLPSDDELDANYDEQPNGALAPEKAAEVEAEAKPADSPAPTQPRDEEIAKLREEWTQRVASLEERETKLAEREKSSDLTTLADLYFERGAPAIVEMVKKWEGVESESDIKDAVADLVSELTNTVLGIELPPDVRDRIDGRRTRKQVRRMREEQARMMDERARQEEKTRESENRVKVRGILQQEISKPDHAKAYPWLAVEPSAGEIILDVIELTHKKDGTKLTWQEAAKRANDYLQQQSTAWIDARRHLLPAAPAQSDGAKAQAPRSQGDQQVRRSQAQPPKPPTPTPPKSEPPMRNGKWDAEAHRRQVKARYRQAFMRQNEE